MDVNDFIPLGSVVDADGYLDNLEESQLEQIIKTLDEENQVKVLMVIKDHAIRSGTMNDFSVGLGNCLGVGLKKKDNGIVITLDVVDRKTYISTGEVTEIFVTDAEASRISRSSDEFFKNKQYFKGLKNILHRLDKSITEEEAKELGNYNTMTPEERERSHKEWERKQQEKREQRQRAILRIFGILSILGLLGAGAWGASSLIRKAKRQFIDLMEEYNDVYGKLKEQNNDTTLTDIKNHAEKILQNTKFPSRANTLKRYINNLLKDTKKLQGDMKTFLDTLPGEQSLSTKNFLSALFAKHPDRDLIQQIEEYIGNYNSKKNEIQQKHKALQESYEKLQFFLQESETYITETKTFIKNTKATFSKYAILHLEDKIEEIQEKLQAISRYLDILQDDFASLKEKINAHDSIEQGKQEAENILEELNGYIDDNDTILDENELDRYIRAVHMEIYNLKQKREKVDKQGYNTNHRKDAFETIQESLDNNIAWISDTQSPITTRKQNKDILDEYTDNMTQWRNQIDSCEENYEKNKLVIDKNKRRLENGEEKLKDIVDELNSICGSDNSLSNEIQELRDVYKQYIGEQNELYQKYISAYNNKQLYESNQYFEKINAKQFRGNEIIHKLTNLLERQKRYQKEVKKLVTQCRNVLDEITYDNLHSIYKKVFDKKEGELNKYSTKTSGNRVSMYQSLETLLKEIKSIEGDSNKRKTTTGKTKSNNDSWGDSWGNGGKKYGGGTSGGYGGGTFGGYGGGGGGGTFGGGGFGGGGGGSSW